MISHIAMHEHTRRLSLVSDNPHPMPRQMSFVDRMLILFVYSASACISAFCFWAVSLLVRSF